MSHHEILRCPYCRAKVAAEVVWTHSWEGEEQIGDKLYPNSNVESCVSCPQCERLLMAEASWIPTSEPPPMNRVYPAPFTVAPEIPEEIRRGMIEAYELFDSGFFRPTGIMCRMIIEGMVKEKGASGNNLDKQIDDLATKGIIEQRLKTWAHALRLHGNDAVHEIATTISEEDARDLLDFTSAILNYVYVIGAKFTAYLQRNPSKLKA